MATSSKFGKTRLARETEPAPPKVKKAADDAIVKAKQQIAALKRFDRLAD